MYSGSSFPVWVFVLVPGRWSVPCFCCPLWSVSVTGLPCVYLCCVVMVCFLCRFWFVACFHCMSFAVGCASRLRLVVQVVCGWLCKSFAVGCVSCLAVQGGRVFLFGSFRL